MLQIVNNDPTIYEKAVLLHVKQLQPEPLTHRVSQLQFFFGTPS